MQQSFTPGFEIILFYTCYQKYKISYLVTSVLTPWRKIHNIFSPCGLWRWIIKGKYLERREKEISKTDLSKYLGGKTKLQKIRPSALA